ncbi:glycosyltransferase [Candidatus Bathyarchaeota archaeon]|nr:glycosyltransferase [Candidatus Bathyarchaeota archaeon]
MQHSYPKVTVGVCVRNCAETLHEAITSILEQTYPHKLMEIIFVDDGSVDETLNIIKDLALKAQAQGFEIKIFHHDWKGLGYSRNLVVKNAKGKYIIWVDGDMILTRDFVKKQASYMEQNPNVAIGKGKYGFRPQGKLVSDLESLEFITTNFRGPEKDLTPLGTGGAIYRVEAVRQVGGFDERLTGAGEDVDIEYRIRKAGWSLAITSAIFFECRRKTWKDLWREYFWHGEGGSRLHKKKVATKLWMFWPPLTLFTEFSRVVLAYKFTRHKIAFLLPFHYLYKRVAWVFGFINGLVKNG